MIQGKSVALLLVVVCSIVYAQIDCAAGNYFQSRSYQYARLIGMTNAAHASQGNGVAFANGFMYSTGNFTGTAQYSPTTLTTTASSNAFVIKISTASTSATQSSTWFVKFGGNTTAATAQGNDIAVDSSDNVYVTGAFTGNVTFGSFVTPVNSPRAMFVAKMSSAGSVQWLFTFDIASEGLGVALDSNNNIYVTGFASGTTTLGGSSVTLSGGFVMALTNAGTFSWINNCGSTASKIAITSTNDIYVSGYFVTNFVYGAQTVYSNGASTEGFAVKISTSGALQWSARFGNSIMNAIAANSQKVFITGTFSGTATIGNSTFTTPGGQSGTNGFVLILNADGSFFSSTHLSSFGASFATNVATDTTGNAYIVGQYIGASTFGPQTIATANTYDIFVSKFNSNGAYLWTDVTGGSGHQYSTDVAYNSAQQTLHVTGYLLGGNSASYGGNVISTSGSRTMTITGMTQTCGDCNTGTFITVPGYYTCTSCVAGTYNSNNGATSCTPCPLGTASTSVGATTSTVCGTCSAGRYANVTGSTQCLSCPAGTASSSGASSCSICPAGSSATANSASCTQCTAGRYSPTAGSASCTICSSGTYSDTSSATSCTPCALGYYTSNTGATICTAAAAGYYVDSVGSSSPSACPAGTYSSSTTAQSSSTCIPCSAGTSSNRVAATSSSSCSPCSLGTYSAAGATSCTKCPAGTHGDSKFANQCFACPAGTYSESAGAPSSSSCLKCKADSKLYSFANATKCDTCPEFCCVGDNQAGCYKCQKGTSDICNSLTSAEEQQNISAGVVFGSFFGMFAGLTALAIVLVICFSVMGVVFGMIAQRVPTTTNAAAPAPVTAENPVYTA